MKFLNRLINLFKTPQNTPEGAEQQIEWGCEEWNYQDITNPFGLTYRFAVIPDHIPTDHISRIFTNEMINLHMKGQLRLGQRHEFKYVLPTSVVKEFNEGERFQQCKAIAHQIQSIELSTDLIAVNYEKGKFFEALNVHYEDYRAAALSMAIEDVQAVQDFFTQHRILCIQEYANLKELEGIKLDIDYYKVKSDFFDKEEIQLTKEDKNDIEFLGKHMALKMKKERHKNK